MNYTSKANHTNLPWTLQSRSRGASATTKRRFPETNALPPSSVGAPHKYKTPDFPHMSADWVPMCFPYMPGEANKHRYVIATQSHPLRVSLRAIPGVPIVHVNRSVMVLEPASDATLQSKQRVCDTILQKPLSLHSYIHFTGRARCARAIQVREGGTECGYTSGRTCCKKKETPKGPKSSQCEKEGVKGDGCCYHSARESSRRNQEEATRGRRHGRCIGGDTIQTEAKA